MNDALDRRLLLKRLAFAICGSAVTLSMFTSAQADDEDDDREQGGLFRGRQNDDDDEGRGGILRGRRSGEDDDDEGRGGILRRRRSGEDDDDD